MKLLLTGPPKIGKTTIFNSVLSNVDDKQGFIASEIRETNERVGFKLISAKGEEAILAHVNIATPHKVSRYSVDIDALDKFIDPLFDFNHDQLLYIDEIGQMELFSSQFKKLVETYLSSNNNFLATITSVYDDEFTKSIKSKNSVIIIELTLENREEIQIVLQSIVKSLNNLQKLSDSQQRVVESLAKGYFNNNKYIQLNKLFNNAISYLVENKIDILNGNEILVKGNTGNHRVLKINGMWSCDCDLFNGKGDFIGKADECSHMQVAKVYSEK